MSAQAKRLVYVNKLMHESYLAVTAGRPELTVERFDNGSDTAAVDRLLGQAHAYQVGASRQELDSRYHVHAAFLRRAPGLLLVSSHGAGYDTIDVAECTAAGVLVVNQAGGNREAVAEHVLGMMLCLSKRIMETDRAMRRAPIRRREAFMGHDIHGKTIGIIGIGQIGSRVAQLCGGMFAMRALAHDPYVDAASVAARGGEKVSLDALLREADYVSINCPFTAETRGMIGRRELALMKPGAHLITTSRGGIHDEAALFEALSQGRLAGAGLDVWEEEPPPLDHPLLQLDSVIATSHTAGITAEARDNMARIAAQQVIDTLDGHRPPRLINPEAWPAFAERFARMFGFAPAG